MFKKAVGDSGVVQKRSKAGGVVAEGDARRRGVPRGGVERMGGAWT